MSLAAAEKRIAELKDALYALLPHVSEPAARHAALEVLAGLAPATAPRHTTGCPHCGSTQTPIIERGDETVHARKGCLACNRWHEPVRLRRT